MVPVDRGAGAQALNRMAERARVELGRDRQLIIFPEGTRRPVGAEPRYKFGVAHLYAAEGVPCVPIALNSGLFWPRRSLRHAAGHGGGRRFSIRSRPASNATTSCERLAARDRDGHRAADRGGER